MKTRLVIIECAGYTFRQLFLWRLYNIYIILYTHTQYTMSIEITDLLEKSGFTDQWTERKNTDCLESSIIDIDPNPKPNHMRCQQFKY